MKSRDVQTRLTSIGIGPFGSVGWTPAEKDVAIARKVITFLEDRRVLYQPLNMEIVDHVTRSVLKTRDRLVEILMDIPQTNTHVRPAVAAMTAACRRCLDQIGPVERRLQGMDYWHRDMTSFGDAVGQLRATMGYQIAYLAATFNLDVDDRLDAILPAGTEDASD